MRRRDFVTLLGSVVVAKPLDAVAQNYPSRVVTIVVPYPAGGPTDTIARILADRMQGSLGQSVIIENVGGAGGSIGVGRVAHALPDGVHAEYRSYPNPRLQFRSAEAQLRCRE
jgi:tripartite-type tricarboxylate transporter receptor subunit TctC